MKETTTTTTALAIIDRKANRAAKAHARHIIDTSGTWVSMKWGIKPPYHRMNITQRAEAATRTVLKNRHQTSGDLPILRQLIESAEADNAWANLPNMAADALALRARHADLTEKAANAKAIADRKATDEETKTAAKAKAKKLQAEADRIRASYQTIEAKAEKLGASDRIDLVHAAVVALLEYGIDDYGQACHAAGQAIRQTASPDALTSTRTRRTEIAEAEAQKLEARAEARTTSDGRISEYITRTGAKGYYTIERKAGKVYKVAHESTVAPYISYDEWASGEAVEGLSNNGGIDAITGQTEAEEIAAFLARANLSDKEQRITRKAADLTARRAGQAAKDKYIDETYPKGAKRITASKWARIVKAGDNLMLETQWENAFQREGIYSKDNRSTIKSRIKSKLEKAKSKPEPDTPEEKTERKARAWERMQANRRRGYRPDNTPRYDLVAWTDKASTNPAPCIDWTEHTSIADWAAEQERKASRTPDTSAKPAGYDTRLILTIIERHTRAANTLALPAQGQSVASTRQAERRVRAESRHPNTTPDTITTPDNPKAAEERRRAEQWARYWSIDPKPKAKQEPAEDTDRAARLAALNTPELCKARLEAMKAARR